MLDNTVISSLHEAGALVRVIELWPREWVVPLQVRDEAAAWKAHGAAVLATLIRIEAQRLIDFATPDPGSEGVLFAQLQRTRGQGESAAIAIAYHRGYAVATDDRQARSSCQTLTPPVPALATESLLAIAIADGLLTRAEAEAIWLGTGILDPRRGLDP